MKLIPQSFEILNEKSEDELLKALEFAGRTCYKSYDRIGADTCKKFVANIIKRGHLSVMEHESIQVKLIIDRGVLAELTRHRIGVAYSVESSRYCNYEKDDIEFIDPSIGKYEDLDKEQSLNDTSDNKFYGSRKDIHIKAYQRAEEYYKELIRLGASPQEARQVLPMALKTEMVMTANLREWRHIFELRCSDAAHPHCKDIFNKILKTFKEKYPTIFGDMTVNPNWE